MTGVQTCALPISCAASLDCWGGHRAERGRNVFQTAGKRYFIIRTGAGGDNASGSKVFPYFFPLAVLQGFIAFSAESRGALQIRTEFTAFYKGL